LAAKTAIPPSAVAGLVWPAIPARADAAALAGSWQSAHSLTPSDGVVSGHASSAEDAKLRWIAGHIEAPANLADDATLLLALQQQFEASERCAPDELERLQLAQLDQLVSHAAHQVPFHAERLRAAGVRSDVPLTWAEFRRIPVMRRSHVQAAGARLQARDVPASHGPVSWDATSGSTAEPIRFTSTALARVIWHALTLREHLWHGRDFGARLAAIRSVLGPGDQPSWGMPADLVFQTGPGFGLRVSASVQEQIDWLLAREPDYLITYPSNLLALAQACLARNIRLTRLREVRTFGERLPAGLRDICRAAWNVPLVDVYSAQEVGYIAMQCPHHEHYHVQSENVVVEILDEADCPCAPGEIGRVVVTSLNNFATPFIRYDLGDYAALGGACDCGRGLPVLDSILGRVRNMAILPDGDRFWPRIRASEWFEIADIREFRLKQTGYGSMVLEIVTPTALTDQTLASLRDNVRARLGHPFEVTIARVDRIARGAAGKFDDFVCEIAQ